MSAKYAILGLVIERPGYGYQLAQRLEERFGSSCFAPSGVYSALDQLSRDELVRAAGEIGPGPARRSAPRMIYEATERGAEHFEAWILGSSPTPPLRDELHMKIALCRPDNLPRLIDLVYGQELVCIGRLRELTQGSDGAGASAGESGAQMTAAPQDWSSLMRALSRDAEIALWKARIEWLRSAKELLRRQLNIQAGLAGECDHAMLVRAR
ncbi:MAG: transcriptional regulator, PadR-like family [Solirubrobacterales bacterium]|jgi:DNA-binding PadR family transcriptional regulator|nr:transcriptional regulator, PadR-like family [Solirubrobacterales bacterium]